jgi:hypothetical protein
MILKKIMIPLLVAILLISCSTSKTTPGKTILPQAPQQTAIAKTDSIKKSIKPYKEVITDKAITQNGLFKVHKIDERYFFEIPDSLINRDILVVNRISKAPTNKSIGNGYGGDWIGEIVIEFSKGPNNKVFITTMSYTERSGDSTQNGMYRAIQNSNFQPISAVFDIKTISPDSSAVILDMTDYLNTDNEIFSFGSQARSILGGFNNLGALLVDKSFINNIRSFPLNIEIKTVKTYSRSAIVSYELNSSLVLLPREPMKPRYEDKRVGYFTRTYINYEASQPVDYRQMITRWRLEPKDADIEKYKRGELVEPKKPIVYYIDPATPKKWVPYLIEGVNEWQKAFEKAGFKNAIYALEAPVNDSTWSLEDARHSAIVYKASSIQNASGPQVNDPRSGEILETHINWYHNIQELMHDWYMVQAGPNDPKARKMQFDDSLMGQLIRYVCAHEVGHTLGLLHNFGASSTIPVDSLRNKHYVEANGFCPSIMDYARFNYVAQPEDGFEEKELIPRIGIYDKWAIEWAYKWFSGFGSEENEQTYLKGWVTSRIENDKRLWFGKGEPRSGDLEKNFDPKCQVEDIGDDAMKAGYWGIQNLKRVVSSLKEWTKEPNKDYEALKKLNKQVIEQYKRYLFHAANNIGGRTWIQKNVEQNEEGASFPSFEQQKSAVQFLQDQLFTTPAWLLNNEIRRLSAGDEQYYVDMGNMYLLLNLQGEVLTKITSYYAYGNILSQQTTRTDKGYTIDELLTDLESGIWKELDTKVPIDIYRRTLQKIYVEKFIRQLNVKDDKEKLTGLDGYFFYFENIFTDVLPIIKYHLRGLLTKITTAIPNYKDKMSRLHLIDIRDRIKKALDYQSDSIPDTSKSEIYKNTFNLFEIKNQSGNIDKLFPQVQIGCWDNQDIPVEN